ncbi:DUF6325 family protein [Nocardioides sp. CER19]|uniref:DUF6325 family protein n=1 Tax=Nocardioides sp. CER19 TaxID=3038538 RepID=UPI0024477017|nr:DUF6325 family protein [Nocardioides sp. CER19]MDH2415235.1 DUF6325 family protein [Nocardioides sp. CER19]
MTAGPVQVLVLGFEEPHFDGSVLAELARLGEAGVVRLVDLLVVGRSDDGSLQTLDGYLDGRGDVAAALLGGEGPGGVSEADTWSLAEVVPERGVAVVALIEHLWAGPLSAALRSAGATMPVETWLSDQDRGLLASLEARRPVDDTGSPRPAPSGSAGHSGQRLR